MIDLGEILEEINVPDLSCPLALESSSKDKTGAKDIFAEQKRHAWDKSVEARCDFSRKVRITRRADVFFISLWQKSLYGRTLTDIKGDDNMVDFFAKNVAPLIADILGNELKHGNWCIVTTPKRRHLVKNFATRISEKIAVLLSIPFYEDVAHCHSTRVRDNILKSKEQKNIQPTKGGHKMVTCQNYVSLFYCQITSCPSDGGIS